MRMKAMDPDWITPEWPAAPGIRALITTRRGGSSSGPFGADAKGARGGLNLGWRSGDSLEAVTTNHAALRAALPGDPVWLDQVHGAGVVDAATVQRPLTADASYTDRAAVVAAVKIADCMPVFLTDRRGLAVAVAHAGWRGLAAGVIQATATALRQRIDEPQASLLAYLGPAIGPDHFEVGAEVLEAMSLHLPAAESAFVPTGEGKYLADLFALGRQALAQVGVDAVFGGGICTFSNPDRFYSHRRDRTTGRHAALIWRIPE